MKGEDIKKIERKKKKKGVLVLIIIKSGWRKWGPFLFNTKTITNPDIVQYTILFALTTKRINLHKWSLPLNLPAPYPILSIYFFAGLLVKSWPLNRPEKKVKFGISTKSLSLVAIFAKTVDRTLGVNKKVLVLAYKPKNT